MIVATLRRARTGGLAAAAIRGHAGAGAPGHDLVCAAVSMLADATLYSLSADHGIEPLLVRAPGVLELALPARLTPAQAAAAQVLLGNLRNGLLLLAQQQPEHISITVEEE